MKETLKSALCVLCFTLSVAPALAALELADIEKQYLKIFPEAGSVGRVDYKDGRYYPVMDKSGKQCGLIIYTEKKGYEGPIKIIVGLDLDAHIVNYLMSQRETPHYVSEIIKPEFKERFKGKGKEQLRFKKDDPAGEIDAVTGATVTSRALLDGLRESATLAGEILKK